MKTGFDTIGNATIIVYDQAQPVLVTDPWLDGSAYFGSWRLSHEIPVAQKESILKARFIWFSHGHPDHLNPDNLERFKGQQILLPDHVGARIKKDLESAGFEVRVLANRTWVQISERVRIMCIADYYQDAILLIDINGRLLVNTNDAMDRGWGRFVRKIVRQYPTSFLLSLHGYGDADMIHFFTEAGERIPPKAALKTPVGRGVAHATESYGIKYYIPFSTMHQYQRTDSMWANQYTTPIEAFPEGFHSKTSQILPAFISWNCDTDEWHQINPQELPPVALPPEHFGDSWTDVLDEPDYRTLREYFQSIHALADKMDFINFRVGGKEYPIELRKKSFNRGITFEAPRHSLMIATNYKIFDDMLIGNFMKTTLHGEWPASKLYPDFIPFVARYADNGNARTKEELHAYFEEYRKRDPIEYILHSFEQRAVDIFRAKVSGESALFRGGKRAYWYVKKLIP